MLRSRLTLSVVPFNRRNCVRILYLATLKVYLYISCQYSSLFPFHSTPQHYPPYINTFSSPALTNRQILVILTMKASCFILAGVFACHAIADGGYAKNCRNMTLVDLDDPHVGLKASCKVGNKDQCSILDLWQCYGTDNGILKPQDK